MWYISNTYHIDSQAVVEVPAKPTRTPSIYISEIIREQNQRTKTTCLIFKPKNTACTFLSASPIWGSSEGHGFRFHEVEKHSTVMRFFSLGSVLLLVALAASMVVLPLFLPPLPPPPLVLLFFPVGIMAALMFLAFSPSEAAGNVAVFAVWYSVYPCI